MTNSPLMDRRRFLRNTAVLSAAVASPGILRADSPPPFNSAGGEGFDFIHLTDMHVTPKRKGDKGYAYAVEQINKITPRPAFVMIGGDMAFDGLYTPKADFEDQIRLYKEITAGLAMPTYKCLGNHDVLGWSARRKCEINDPDIGKKMIQDRLEWPKTYYSFDHGGWHFAVLDSIFPVATPTGPSHELRIGPEQLEWLGGDLGAAGDRPKIVVTHVAAFCNSGQQSGSKDGLAMNANLVLADTVALRDVCDRHGVKAVLQGHSHKTEETRWRNTWYLTSPAVSGAWWSGSLDGFGPGYTHVQCRGDTLTWKQVPLDWVAQLEPEDSLERKRIETEAAKQTEQNRLRELERRGLPTTKRASS